MADLDYSYLADHAQVSDGKLSALGASFTHVFAPTLPASLRFAVAGRIRSRIDAGPVGLELTVTPPGSGVELNVGGTVEATAGSRTYQDGKVGILFTVDINYQLDEIGLYTVTIAIDGEQARTLAFEVETQPAAE